MKRFVSLFIALCTLATTAAAEPYWYAYEGNDFPENEGWHHGTSGPAAQRWLDNGSLFVDTRVDPDTRDAYARVPSSFTLDDGETFVMQWRLTVAVVEIPRLDSAGVAVITDDGYAVTFVHGKDYVTSTYEAPHSASFQPDVPHEFEMRSDDMRSYQLFLDGVLALEGTFRPSFSSAGAGFGDLTSIQSLTQWDYFRFGVVPEPAGCSLFAVSILLGRAAR